MDRKSFITTSVGFIALGSLTLMGCNTQREKKKKKYMIDAGRCVGCGKCFKACDERALRFEGKVAVIDQSKCEACGDCQKICNHNAILSA